MAIRIKRAIPGRLVGSRFIPNPKKSSVEEVLYRKFRKEGYSRSEAKRYAKLNAPYFGGAKNPSPGYKAYPTSLLKQLLDAPPQQVSTRQKKAIIRELRRRGVSVEHLARFYKANPAKVAITMLKGFEPKRGGLMLAGNRYYVSRSDAEELKRRGVARITHEGKRKRNPKSKVKTKVVKRGDHWFAELSVGAGTFVARYDTKAEAQKAARDYRATHKRGHI
jgi:hypothetical protein